MASAEPLIIMIISYSHDIATAFLAVSGIALGLLLHWSPRFFHSAEDRYFIDVCRKIKVVAKISLVWILIAGIPRILFYKEYEWSAPAGDLQIVAIIIKHIVMFLLVGLGIYGWVRLERIIRSRELKPFGINGNCAGTGGVFRIDRSWSLDWVGSFLP